MTQESLERMEIETLDVQYFHVWTDTWAEDEGWQRTVQDLKDKGMSAPSVLASTTSSRGMSSRPWRPAWSTWCR
jgi:aryl-alcohol dehydrogenase-like predicted oxidoreductase